MGRRRDHEYNWTAVPPNMTRLQASELMKRVLAVETKIGVLASVHLEKVDLARGVHAELARSIYPWIFDCHDVVMGDMNTTWRQMIGAEDPTRSTQSKGSTKRVASIHSAAWVSAETHACVHRPSYLPNAAREDRAAIEPAAFDQVIVTRPLCVELLKSQPGKKLTSCKVPRSLMHSLKWPSDHTSVVAAVRNGDLILVVATWNVADPLYFGRFHEGPEVGFEWQPESERLSAIEAHVTELLDCADAVGLQEVPADLVARLVRLGATCGFQVHWVAAPSQLDEDLFGQCVGRRGCSTSEERMSSSALANLPPVAHDMLLVRYVSLKTPPSTLEGSLAAALLSSMQQDVEAPPLKAKGYQTIEGTEEPTSVTMVETAEKIDVVPESWEDL